jgi:parallel beta-helix repeat protein
MLLMFTSLITTLNFVQIAEANLITVDDDGGADYYTIQEGINAAQNGDTVYVFAGDYYEWVVVDKSIILMGEDKFTTTIYGTDMLAVPAVHIMSDMVSLSGFTVSWNFFSPSIPVGIKAESDYNTISDNRLGYFTDKGIYLYQANNNTIMNNILTGDPVSGSNSGCGIYIEKSRDNTITYNDFTKNNCGISLTDASTNDVFNNTMVLNTGNGIRLYNSSENTIKGNSFSDIEPFISFLYILLQYSNQNNITENYALESSSGINLMNSHENNITENEGTIQLSNSDFNNIRDNYVSTDVDGWHVEGIMLEDSKHNFISNNTMEDVGIFITGELKEYWNSHEIDTSNTVMGKQVHYWKNVSGGIAPEDAGEVILANCSNVTIQNLLVNNSSVGIELGFSTNINVTNNSVSHSKHGIYVEYSNDNYLINNNLSCTSYGVVLQSSNLNNVSCNIGDPSLFGIRIQYSKWNNITSNQLSDSKYGIALSSSESNEIAYNIVQKATSYAIRLRNSDNNSIHGNEVSNSHWGIFLELFSDNNTITKNNVWNNGYHDLLQILIFHNNLINNKNQAFDNFNIANTWDNGYPSGGNYWSDYNGSDFFKGPNQDIPGGDGIGDTNYSIDLNSIDNYPLMRPYGNYIFLFHGWNLISIPFNQTDASLNAVLSSIKGGYDAVQRYNANGTTDPWKHHHISKPSHLNDLNEIDHKIGFYVHITEPDGTLFEYSGIQLSTNQTIPIKKGWNLIGYPSNSNKNRTEALNNLVFDVDIDIIQTYNAETKKWEEMGIADNFKVGRGYWFHATTDCIWVVPL